MTPTVRRRYQIARAVCVIDIALCAIAIHYDPYTPFAPMAMGLCIAIGVVATQRLRKAKAGVLA